MTVQRTMMIGFGGALAVIAAGAMGNLVGGLVEQVLGEEWAGHAVLHIVFGVLALAIALWMGRVRRATLASGWAERGLATARLIAFVVSATAIVEGIGAYPGAARPAAGLSLHRSGGRRATIASTAAFRCRWP